MSKPSARFRPVDGVILLDKPLGLSSNQALQRVRHLFKAAKAGHTGSLDPMATGVLPICFGEATKFSSYLLNADKVYVTRAALGITTDSGDAEGKVIRTEPVPEFSEAQIQSVLGRFLGAIEQIPPMYSALKHQGTPLYKLAREGVDVERKPRPVTIHRLTLLSWGPDFLELEVSCSKGTYIRTLVEDIGNALGCGAHVAALRRTETAGFGLDRSYTLEQLQVFSTRASEEGWEEMDALLLPSDAGLSEMPIISLDPAQTHSILLGQMVKIQPGLQSGLGRLKDVAGRFIGLGDVQEGVLKPHRLIRVN